MYVIYNNCPSNFVIRKLWTLRLTTYDKICIDLRSITEGERKVSITYTLLNTQNNPS